MNRRVLLLILLLVILLGGGYFLLQSGALGGGTGGNASGTPVTSGNGGVVQNLPTATPIRVKQIVVAQQELPRGLVIPEGGVSLEAWPEANLPQYFIDDPNLVVGKIARTDIPRGSAVMQTQLVDNVFQIARTGSDPAAVMPAGLRAITIPIDRLANVAHAPQPGDRVDVIMSFLIVDVDEEFQSILPNRITLLITDQEGNLTLQDAKEGRAQQIPGLQNPAVVGPRERQRPRLVTQLTVQNALVVYVGTFPEKSEFIGVMPTPTAPPTEPPQNNEQGNNPTPVASPTPAVYNPDMITLAVEPQDALALAFATDHGIPVTLILRPATDNSIANTTAVTLEYMLQAYNIPQPPTLPFALEPRISSIRKLVKDNLVPLEDANTNAAANNTAQ